MRTATLLQDDQNQMVRLPEVFRFSGQSVFVKKVGNAVILIPNHDSWQSLFSSLDQFSDDFMASREQPEQQMRESAFG